MISGSSDLVPTDLFVGTVRISAPAEEAAVINAAVAATSTTSIKLPNPTSPTDYNSIEPRVADTAIVDGGTSPPADDALQLGPVPIPNQSTDPVTATTTTATSPDITTTIEVGSVSVPESTKEDYEIVLARLLSVADDDRLRAHLFDTAATAVASSTTFLDPSPAQTLASGAMSADDESRRSLVSVLRLVGKKFGAGGCDDLDGIALIATSLPLLRMLAELGSEHARSVQAFVSICLDRGVITRSDAEQLGLVDVQRTACRYIQMEHQQAMQAEVEAEARRAEEEAKLLAEGEARQQRMEEKRIRKEEMAQQKRRRAKR